MKVIVGISGGVDSAVSIYLLQKKGYEVEALFMRNWDSTLNMDVLGNPNNVNDVCPQEKDYLDAKSVCDKLGVKLHRVDFVKEYWDEVFTYLIDEYKSGRTPNPDILCNKYIKFDKFLKCAKRLGAEKIAMGHFVIKKHGFLFEASDQNKDQSYFLCHLTPEQIESCLFPVGKFTKQRVRNLAKKLGLLVATKPDSTGICFIGERHFKEFLKNYIPANPGKIFDDKNNQIGMHEGVMYYTIGQRHGLKIGGDGKPWFVYQKCVKTNALFCCQGRENKLLFYDTVTCENINLNVKTFPKKFYARFRYRSKKVKVNLLSFDGKEVILKTKSPVWALAPGQAAAFYSGKKLIGGAFIKSGKRI